MYAFICSLIYTLPRALRQNSSIYLLEAYYELYPNKQAEGFQRLVAEVGLGQAGLVIGLEVSRLARNNTDWHRLLEICALTDTLLLDEDELYDPGFFNDRLLLGLKGAMSEAEIHFLRARLQGGILNAAPQGGDRLRSPPRSGPALIQGMVLCGKCG